MLSFYQNSNFVSSALKRFDFFGQQLTLNMNRCNNYTTSVGGASSIIIIFVICIFFYGNILDFVNKEKAYDKSETEFQIDPPLIIMNNSNFMAAFSIDQVNFTSRPLFNITLEQKQYRRELNGSMSKKITLIQMQPCQLEQFTSKVLNGNTKFIQDQFISLGMQNWLCPTQNYSLQLQGSYGTQEFQFGKITVKNCVNNTDNTSSWNPICASQEDLDSQFESAGSFKVQIYQINTVINPGKAHNYLQIYLDTDIYFTFIPQKFMNQVNIYYREYQISQDNSLLPYEDIQNLNVIIRTQEDIRDMSMTGQETSTIYSEIFLRRSQLNTSVTRNYQKIGDLLAQIGGFTQVVRLLFAIIIIFYNRTSLLFELSNKLYDFKEQNNHQSYQQKQQSQKLIQETQKVKELLETNTNAQRGQVRSNTVFKKTVLEKLTEQSAQISFTLKLLLNQISCGVCFNGKNAQFFRKAIDKINEDLDLQSILYKLCEINKLKEVLFDPSQLLLFNFTPRPIITLEEEKLIPSRMTFVEECSPKNRPSTKQQSNQSTHNIQNIVYQAYTDILEDIDNSALSKYQKEINFRLINLLGNDVIQIFKEQLLNQPKEQECLQLDSPKSNQINSKNFDEIIQTERINCELIP